MNLEQLRARLKELAGELDVLMTKDTLTDEEIVSIEAKTAEIETMKKKIATLERGEQTRAALATAADEPTQQRGNVPAAPDGRKLDNIDRMALTISGIVEAHECGYGRNFRGVAKALEEHGFGAVARDLERAQTRTLNSQTATGGGIMIPDTTASEFIDLLRPNTTFLASQPRQVAMPNGHYRVLGQATAASVAYRGETKPAMVSQPTFKAISMTAKLLAGIVPMSDQIDRWSLPSIRPIVEQDLALQMGLKMDLAGYTGDGLNDTPLGIFNQIGISSFAASGGLSPSISQIEGDARKMELAMTTVNLVPIRAAWIMTPRTHLFLQDLRDGLGNRYFPEIAGENPRWRGKPVRVTTNLPENGGGTTDEAQIALVSWGHVYLGVTLNMRMKISDTATVVNGTQTINAWQDGVILIQAESEHDFDLQHPEAVSLLTGVRWGA